MTLAMLESVCETALARYDAGDYDGAIAAARKILLVIGSKPDVSQGTGGGSRSFAFRNQAAVEGFIRSCQQAKAEAAHAVGGSGMFMQSGMVGARAQ